MKNRRRFYVLPDVHNHIHQQFDRNLTSPQWGTYSTRLFHCLTSMIQVFDAALEENDTPLVVSVGDIFHIRGKILTEVFNAVKSIFQWAISQGVEIIAIPGNHDYAFNDRPVHALDGLKPVGVQVIDDPNDTYVVTGFKDFGFIGVGYCADEHKLLQQLDTIRKRKFRIPVVGFFHAQIKGVAFESGFLAQNGISRKQFPKNLSLILNGHHHTPKRLSSRFYNVGALLGHSFSDVNSKRGYWKVYVEKDKLYPKFIENTIVPKFIEVDAQRSDISKHVVSKNYVRVINVDPVKIIEVEESLRKYKVLDFVVSTAPAEYFKSGNDVDIEFKPFDNLVTLFENYMVIKDVKEKKRKRLLILVESLMGGENAR